MADLLELVEVYDALAPRTYAETRIPCRVNDPELWFPERQRDANSPEYARRLCAGCPDLAECGAGALARGETWGIWGGMSEKELRQRSTRALYGKLAPR